MANRFCYGVYPQSHPHFYLVLLRCLFSISRFWSYQHLVLLRCLVSISLVRRLFQSHAYGFTINLVLLQHLYRCHACGYLVSATATVSILNLTPWIYHKVGSATVSTLNLMPLATWFIFSRSRSHAYTYLVLLWLRQQCLFSISSRWLWLLGSATMSILNLRLLCYQQFGQSIHSATVNSIGLRASCAVGGTDHKFLRISDVPEVMQAIYRLKDRVLSYYELDSLWLSLSDRSPDWYDDCISSELQLHPPFSVDLVQAGTRHG